ncbi:MAG: hypothetical protein V3T19_05600 [Acidiferrobacterales bacterium]
MITDELSNGVGPFYNPWTTGQVGREHANKGRVVKSWPANGLGEQGHLLGRCWHGGCLVELVEMCIMTSARRTTLEITLWVNGLESSGEGSSNSPDGLLNVLQGLEGILGARYDGESHRFFVTYNPKRVTILGILNQIEFAGQRIGRTYRPTEVHSSYVNTCHWKEVWG